MFSIRTTYPDSICYRPDGAASDSIALPFLLGSPVSIAVHVLLGNPDGVDPDSLAHAVSSGWERKTFQLIRIDISGSSGSAYPVKHAQLQCSPEAS